MVEYYPEFFNDVFGPVMQPGSSSHTAGPCRLGILAHQLLKAPLRDIVIEIDENGSYAGTFGHMYEDLGMLAGAYGLLPDDERMYDIRNILDEAGINYKFSHVHFPAGSHPNAVRYVLTDVNGNTVTLMGNSTGGGMVETVQIMDIPYRYVGDAYLTCSTEKPTQAEGILGVDPVTTNEGEHVFFVLSEKGLDSAGSGSVLFTLTPILPVPATAGRKAQLFTSFTEWIEYADKNGLTLPQAAIEYERRASGWSEEKIRSYMEDMRKIMERQTQAVYEDDSKLIGSPYSGYHYSKWREYEKNARPLSGSVTALAVHYVFGVQAQIRGVKMVPGPMGTGGGFLYSAVRAVKETYGFDDEKVIDGLLVAAGVGAICYTRTAPTGEMIGCTGDCGCCGTMAAAAITQMAGGTPQQVEAAASLTLQAALGWPCDPIPGGENQPCMSRVLASVNNAILFSDLALSGRDCVVPLHEVLDEADALGKQMPADLKCTSCGGLCETPTGKRCKYKFEQWHAQHTASGK